MITIFTITIFGPCKIQKRKIHPNAVEIRKSIMFDTKLFFSKFMERSTKYLKIDPLKTSAPDPCTATTQLVHW